MNSKELVNLMFSPQWIAKLLHHFISGAQQVNLNGIKTELLHLSLPFIIDDVTREKLLTANSRSTFSSTFTKTKVLEIKDSLYKKDVQIKQYREFINKGLIYLSNIETLNIGEFITIDRTVKYQNEKDIIKVYCKAAFSLGIILGKEDYRNIIVKLGVTNL